MTAIESSPSRPEGNRSAGVTRLLFRDRTPRQRLDDALAAIGGGAFVVLALRITDLIDPHLLGGIRP